MKKNKFTEEYGYTYDYDGPESDDPRGGNDVSFAINIYDKHRKLVYTGYLSYPSIPFKDQLEKDAHEEAEKIIDEIRPRTKEEWTAIFKKMKDDLNSVQEESKNLSFFNFFLLRNG
jgi:Iap family predicted aminopeptidase